MAGNKKGIFTRQRQPKWAAHILRARYHELAKEDAERYESVLKALIEEN